jgi:hypothetical protein
MIDMDSRLRVARGIAKTETEACIEVFETLKRRGHSHAPPPTISDGWGGIDDAMVDVYGVVPEYRAWDVHRLANAPSQTGSIYRRSNSVRRAV